MSEEAAQELEQPASHDDNVASSPTPDAELKPEGQEEASATDSPDEPKKPNKVQQRINQLTTKNYEEKQKNASLEARIKELESNTEKPKPDLVAPSSDDFDSEQEYQTANAQYYADVSLKATNDRIDTQTREAAQQTRQDSIQAKKSAFDENVSTKRDNFQDFEDVAYGHNFMDMDLAEQIFDMDKGPEVAYYLGSNLDEAERIFSLSERDRTRELTRLEYKVEALSPKRVSDAPDPIKPLGGSEVVDNVGKDGANLSTDEWQAWRNQQVHG